MVGNRNSGRRRKNVDDKRVVIRVSSPFRKVDYIKALEYSNSKMFQFIQDVVITLSEAHVELEALKKGSNASTADLVDKVVSALVEDNEIIVQREDEEERKWNETRDTSIENTLAELCDKKNLARMRSGNYPSLVHQIVENDVTGALTEKMVSRYMQFEWDESRHKDSVLRVPRTPDEVRAHFEPILRRATFERRTPPVQFPMETREPLVTI